MTFQRLAHRDLRSPANLKIIWTVSTLAGGAFMLTAILVALRQLQRRRTRSNNFRQACLRDPSLTWDEYERRDRLTRSRLIFEEEVQRSIMIRKCQQSRASDCKDTVTVEETLTRPARSRSRTWHGQSRSMVWEDGDVEQGKEVPRDIRADWESAQASVDRTWQLLHRSKSPPPRNGLLWNQAGGHAHQGSQIVRPKTPPLLSHPLFRDGNQKDRLKHMSLPTEVTRARTGQMGSLR